ncbi:glutathione S-transferase family protein [Legionella anisa]|uniref:Glutathione S-transferase family protein n=1 Tax=Legionella anisa TaxID=28082 RepID=A0AAX0WS72_9GAMM|nr:glutathione S-transferase family protein [Legionella anisa]AWN74893.1 glutathione S-transferase family protein [Legionella anisa]KTC68979.1 glutathione S-transferase [Legionella anisa]MCW8424905.1 glutathione S-transferase family protein [Legionella anisa]MCW8445975.1 glutathione S-transferase family protein [Legionella anisa]PNL61149.1 glutathione S-transferase family protein [Legionella anisa]
MITLYGAPASVFVRKPRILLHEKSVPFWVDPINLYQYVNEDFQQASPLNKIPALRDASFTLADSSAICAYIDKKYPTPSFYPQNPEDYARALWFEEYADTVLFQAIAPCYYQTILVPLYYQREPDFMAIDRAITQNLPPVAQYLETQLAGKLFFVKEQFSIADVAVVSIFMNMHFSGYPLDSKRWPNLSTYLNTHFQRESIHCCIEEIERELIRTPPPSAPYQYLHC